MRNGVARSIAGRDAGDDRLSGREPERSALKRKVLDGDGDVLSLELAEGDRDRVRRARLRAIFLQANRVALDVAKLQRIRRRFGGGEFLVLAVVEERGEAGLGADRHVIAGARDNHEIGFEILVEDHSPLSGHLTQRFSGVSRRRSERIFGGTTFEIQFMRCVRSVGSAVKSVHFCAALTPCASLPTSSVDGGDGQRRRLSAVERKSDRLDNGRTDHHAVRGFRNRAGAFGVLDAEPDRDRQLRTPLEPRHGFAHQLGVRRGGARDAGDRNKIDEAAGVFENFRQTVIAVVGATRRTKASPRLARGQANLVVFFRRAIDDDEPVDARGFRVPQERLDAIDIDGIVIAHQDHWRVRVPGAEFFHHPKRRRQRLLGFKRPAAGGLNCGAVGDRIGKRHAEFDNVRAGRRQRGENRRDVSPSGSPAMMKVKSAARRSAATCRKRKSRRAVMGASLPRRPPVAKANGQTVAARGGPCSNQCALDRARIPIRADEAFHHGRGSPVRGSRGEWCSSFFWFSLYSGALGPALQFGSARPFRNSVLLLVPARPHSALGAGDSCRGPDRQELGMFDHLNLVATAVFVFFFGLVSVLGFVAARWKAADLGHIHEWGLGGRRFGRWITWFLLGGDLYTAYTVIAIPAVVFAIGAFGFFAVPYTIIVYPFLYLTLPRLWAVSHKHGYITAADFVLGRYGHKGLELAVARPASWRRCPISRCSSSASRRSFCALGFSGQGIMAHAPITIAFVILALFTYKSGLRAPAMIAFVKDAMIYIFIIAAIVIIPYELGGFGAIFAAAGKAFDAKVAANPESCRRADAQARASRSLHHARDRFGDGVVHVSARADGLARGLKRKRHPLQHDDAARLFLGARLDRSAWADGDRRRGQSRHAPGRRAAACALGVSRLVRRLLLCGDRAWRARAGGGHVDRRGQHLHPQHLEAVRSPGDDAAGGIGARQARFAGGEGRRARW